MENLVDYLSNLNNNTKFIYISICVLILYISVNVLHIKLGHIIALPLILLFISYVYSVDTTQEINLNTDLDYKLSSLLDFTGNTDTLIDGTLNNGNSQSKTIGIYDINPIGYNPPPIYFYLDANLINFYYDFKDTFFKYSPKAYIRSIKAANNLLEKRNDFEIELYGDVVTPNMLDNFAKTYQLQYNNKNNKTLKNAYPEYLVAEEQYRLALNHLQSFIFNIPSESLTHIKHQKLMERAGVLLKRNLDIIYKIYKKKRDLSDSVITDYDNAQPYNKLISEDDLTSSFNFY